MRNSELIVWLLDILLGFGMGSVLFCKLIPKMLLKKDICEISADHNPGAANVFMNCGILMGVCCLILDIAKGFLPVYWAQKNLNTASFLFAFVIAAPVLGHAISPWNGFHGGKCIATSFGVLLGLLPSCYVVLILAVVYVAFSTLIKINPHRKRSIFTFVTFGTLSSFIMLNEHSVAIAAGCAMISAIAVAKHMVKEPQPDAEYSQNAE